MGQPIPPAVDGVEQRLDELLGLAREIRDRLPVREPGSPAAGRVELREPDPPTPPQPAPPPVRKPPARKRTTRKS